VTLSEYVRKTLTEFVRIPSTPDTDMSGILQAAAKAIEDLGLRATVHADVKAVVASSGRGGASVCGRPSMRTSRPSSPRAGAAASSSTAISTPFPWPRAGRANQAHGTGTSSTAAGPRT